jgi:hypothetical protein
VAGVLWRVGSRRRERWGETAGFLRSAGAPAVVGRLRSRLRRYGRHGLGGAIVFGTQVGEVLARSVHERDLSEEWEMLARGAIVLCVSSHLSAWEEELEGDGLQGGRSKGIFFDDDKAGEYWPHQPVTNQNTDSLLPADICSPKVKILRAMYMLLAKKV